MLLLLPRRRDVASQVAIGSKRGIIYYTTLHYPTLHYTMLHYTILYSIILYYNILYYTVVAIGSKGGQGGVRLMSHWASLEI